MRKAAFQKLLMMEENNVRKASVLSGYSRSSYYYRHKEPVVISSRNRHISDSAAEAAVLEATEKVALDTHHMELGE
jgi:hypothetical protein